MLNFAEIIDLPMVWGGLIATALLLYALLDGFDIGVGILLPWAPSNRCRDVMASSIAPIWDTNETWLVLAGGGLFIVFPLAYAILLPAFYIPIITMLCGLVLRGVGLELRFKASERSKPIWTWIMSIGSLLAALSQGAILGSFLQGVKTSGRNFAGHPMDWFTPFSILSAVGVTIVYVLLGATWTIYKSTGATKEWARGVAAASLPYAALMMAGAIWLMDILHVPCFATRNPAITPTASLTTHLTSWMAGVGSLGLGEPGQLPPFTCLITSSLLWTILIVWMCSGISRSLRQRLIPDYIPLLLSFGTVTIVYIGIMSRMYPWAIPFRFTLAQAAASPESLSIVLAGIAVILPIILGYTWYCYRVFRGKSDGQISY